MSASSELAIDVRGLVKKYKDQVAVDSIDLQVRSGEIFAILGPNGAGKTTTVEILEGYRERDGGEVQVLGEDPGNLGVRSSAWRNRIGIVLQSAGDVGDLTVTETISHFAKYYSTPRDPLEVIKLVGLSEKAKDRVGNLSGGQRRRVDVALGIIGTPEILFLDEPTTGFDPEARRAFWELILALKASGTTILLTTHYLDEAEALADRVAVIKSGKILEVSTPQELGGRATAKVKITWRDSGQIRELATLEPTKELLALQAHFRGEIPELEVRRPSLEDIYLEMIEGKE